MPVSEGAIIQQWESERTALEHREDDLRAAVKRAEDGLMALRDIVNRHRDVFDASDAWADGYGVFRAIRVCDEYLGDRIDELARAGVELDDCNERYARLLLLACEDPDGGR